jgi:hypothetical protein
MKPLKELVKDVVTHVKLVPLNTNVLNVLKLLTEFLPQNVLVLILGMKF